LPSRVQAGEPLAWLLHSIRVLDPVPYRSRPDPHSPIPSSRIGCLGCIRNPTYSPTRSCSRIRSSSPG